MLGDANFSNLFLFWSEAEMGSVKQLWPADQSPTIKAYNRQLRLHLYIYWGGIRYNAALTLGLVS